MHKFTRFYEPKDELKEHQYLHVVLLGTGDGSWLKLVLQDVFLWRASIY